MTTRTPTTPVPLPTRRAVTAVATGFLVSGMLLGGSIGSADASEVDVGDAAALRASSVLFPPRVPVVPRGVQSLLEVVVPLVEPAPEPEPEVTEPEVATPEPAAPVAVAIAPASGAGPFASAVFAETNRVRAANGLPALAWTGCGAASAAAWSANLIGRGLFHQDMGAVIAACPPAISAGENLATAPGTAADMVTMWVNSPGHLANILDPQFTHLGVGCVADSGGTTCTQVFLSLR